MGKTNITICVDTQEPNTSALIDKVSSITGKELGALVSFTGICRDEDGQLEALILEHYPAMAEAELNRIAEMAQEKWACDKISIHHRYGRVQPGETIVAVVTASRHRESAFQSAHFIMDYLKSNAPFWKKEIWKNNKKKASWVKAKQADEKATKRWIKDDTSQ